MAHKEELLRSIKKAMQGEKDSVLLYENAAAHATETEVKEFFESRSAEERMHYNFLLKYYQEISRDATLSQLDQNTLSAMNLHPIFSNDFIQRIGADQYLFSAVSTALLLEKDAFEHYHKCSQQAENMTLQSFFALLEKWEMAHYDELLKIQKEAELVYWEHNDFEPF